MAHRVSVFAGGHHLRRHRRSSAQHHRPPAAGPREGVTVTGTSDPHADAESLGLLEDGLRKTMLSTSGAELDAALTELGWADMLTDMPEQAVPLVFRLPAETGSHRSGPTHAAQHA